MSKLKDLVPGIKENNLPQRGINVYELKKGVEVEMEHVATFKKIVDYYMTHKQMPSIKQMSEWVARDHLKELDDYYTRLEKMEGSNGLKESQVGDMYIQIGEAIETIDSGCEELAKLLKTPDPGRISQEFREIENIRSSILALKEMYSDGYDFDWKK